MAKGQHLTGYQRGIVKRYYEHADTLAITKLQELVSDLYLAESPKAAAKLWASAKTALQKLGVDPAQAEKIAAAGDVKELARIVGELGGGKGGGTGGKGTGGKPGR